MKFGDIHFHIGGWGVRPTGKSFRFVSCVRAVCMSSQIRRKTPHFHNNSTARTHARTKTEIDFPVGLTPQPPILNK